MKHIDSWIIDGMRTLAEREPPGEAPVALLVSRGRRSRRNRAVLAVSASSMALALSAAGTVALLSSAGGVDTAVPPPSTVPVSASRLAAAAAATANTSYKLRYADSVMPLPGAELTAQQRAFLDRWKAPLISEGAYDRNTASGYLITPQRGGGSTMEQRLVNGEQFVGAVGGPFQHNPGRHERLSFAVLGSGALLTWVEPSQLLAHLGELETYAQTGPHTYRFQADASVPSNKDSKGGGAWNPARLSVTGEVTIGATSGMVEKVVITAPVDVLATDEPYMQVSITIEFTGFGERVVVQRPLAVSSTMSSLGR